MSHFRNRYYFFKKSRIRLWEFEEYFVLLPPQKKHIFYSLNQKVKL